MTTNHKQNRIDFLQEEYTDLATRLNYADDEYDVEEIVSDMGCIERKINTLLIVGVIGQ
mgnify:CR=1 FL=1